MLSSNVWILCTIIIDVVIVVSGYSRSSCPTETVTGNNGTIVLNKTSDLCRWNITVDPGKVVEAELKFTKNCFVFQWDVIDNVVQVYFFSSNCTPTQKNMNVLSSSTNTMTMTIREVRFLPSTFFESGLTFVYHGRTRSEARELYKDCGGIITAPSGVITSPGFPNTYETRLKCRWEIILQSKHVKLSFLDLDLANPNRRCGDFVQLYGKKSGKLGGYRGRRVIVGFLSNNENVAKGFQLYFTPNSTNGCDSDVEVFRDNPTFSSPGFPDRYLPNVKCTYIIKGFLKNGLIHLQFTHFDVLCPDEIRANQLNRRWVSCGTQPYNITFSAMTKLQLKFISDTDLVASGFQASYTLSECKFKLTGKSGTFKSVNYPDGNLQKLRCIWTVEVQNGLFAQIIFKNFSLGDVSCDEEYLQVYTGRNDTLGVRYCLNKIVPVITSYDNVIVVKLVTSDDDSRSNGFLAEYKGIQKRPAPEKPPPACGGVLKKSKGVITSPGYPNNYVANLNCTWIIKPRNKYTYISINVTLDTEPWIVFKLRRICKDYLLFNGLDVKRVFSIQNVESYTCDSKFEFTRCGKEEFNHLSSAKKLKVQFVSDFIHEWKGFHLTYNTIFNPCGGNLTTNQGRIVFDGLLPAKSTCRWTITVDPGLIIALKIWKIKITRWSRGYRNCFDQTQTAVIIHDGIYGYISRYCDREIVWKGSKAIVYSKSNVMIVEFTSFNDLDLLGHELNARYTECDKSHNKATGVISPIYRHNHFCVWKITVDKDYYIQWNISSNQEIETCWPSRCTCDYVAVNDHFKIRRMCGAGINHVSDYYSKISNEVTVRFRTDDTMIGESTRRTYTSKAFIFSYKPVKFHTAVVEQIHGLHQNYSLFISEVRKHDDFILQPTLNPLDNMFNETILNFENSSQNMELNSVLQFILKLIMFYMNSNGEISQSIPASQVPSSARNVSLLINATLLAQIDILNMTFTRARHLEGFLYPKEPKTQRLQKLYNLLPVMLGETTFLISHLNHLDKIGFPQSNNVSQPPYLHLNNFNKATVALAMSLFENLMLMSTNEVSVAGICPANEIRPACILEKIEEMETKFQIFIQIARQRKQKDTNLKVFLEDILSSRAKILKLKEDLVKQIS